jgi:hypothetical protein
MALTTTTIKWSGGNADVTIDGTTNSNVASPFNIELPQGDHTCTIIQNGKTIYNDTLHVPKALADKVEEEIQSRNLVTQSELQTQVETALETSQGYIDIVEVKDESVYNTGQNSDETLTQWKLYYKVVQPQGGSVPAKIKTIDENDQATTVNVDLNATNSALLVYNPPAGGADQATIKEIQILAGNNKVIDKLDLSMIVTETDVPVVCDCGPLTVHMIAMDNDIKTYELSRPYHYIYVKLAGNPNPAGYYIQRDSNGEDDPYHNDNMALPNTQFKINYLDVEYLDIITNSGSNLNNVPPYTIEPKYSVRRINFDPDNGRWIPRVEFKPKLAEGTSVLYEQPDSQVSYTANNTGALILPENSKFLASNPGDIIAFKINGVTVYSSYMG